MKKAVPLEQAVAMIPKGATVMVGGFMGVGCPPRLIDELVRQRRGGLTLISNDTARPGVGVGRLIDTGLVRKVIASHIGTNAVTHRSKSGSKIVPRCSLPITSVRRVDLVVTELAVIRPTEQGLVLEETAPGVSVREVVDATDADLILAPGLAP